MGIVDETTQRGSVPVQDLDETIAAVEGIGRELNAVTSAMGERARTLARESGARASAGDPPRPLEGVPFAIKDVIDVAGLPTTMGSAVVTGPDPAVTAPVVRLLEDAGALPVAKTNCQEFSYGILGDESAFRRVVNPLDPALCTGGSSSGSAALVAAGVVPLALGTDTAGSVRIPADCQGIIGFKPTFGLVPVDGVFPLSPSFDTVGLLARDWQVLAEAFAVISGTDADRDDIVPPTAGAASAPTVDLTLLDAATGDSAATVRAWTEQHLGEVRTTSAISERWAEISAHLYGIYDIVRRYEATAVHAPFSADQLDRYQPGVRAKVQVGQSITEAEYRTQLSALDELRASAVSLFDDVDFLITPAIDGEVIRWDAIVDDSAARFMHYSLPFNVLGWPAVTVPIGAGAGAGAGTGLGSGTHGGPVTGLGSETGAEPSPRPTSLQIVGPPHSDRELLAFAASLR